MSQLSPEQVAPSNALQQNFLKTARQVIEHERLALVNLAEQLDHNFVQACQLMLNCRGKIIVIGLGKSGHIGNKIAATLASTGSPAFFLHASEANHGDLGAIQQSDVILALSYSGNTEEILRLLPSIRGLEIPVIAITGNPNSALAKIAQVHLHVAIPSEACHLGLAPTTSSTTTLVLGDALAIALSQAKNFTPHDFARSHPSGSLGRKLLMNLSDIMLHTEQTAIVQPQTSISETLIKITEKGLGLAIVADQDLKICGVFTDGDLRRTINLNIDLKTPIQEVMSPHCISVPPQMLASQAAKIMEEKKITSLVVASADNKLLGVVTIRTLLTHKII